MAEGKSLPLDDQTVAVGKSMDIKDELPNLDSSDPNFMNKMEKELVKKHPEMKYMFDNLRGMQNDRVEQAQDSSLVVKNRRGFITPDLLNDYPDSPTAQYTVEALYSFCEAFQVFDDFKKDEVKTEKDCRTLEPGFHSYIQGFLLADHVSRQCPLPENIAKLTEGYLRLRPNDTIVEYFQVAVVTALEALNKSDYEGSKSTIRALELFAHKIAKYKSVESERIMLQDTYYRLGSIYRITHQYERSEDAFRKCYNLDKTDISALYAVAEAEREKEPEQAIKHLMEYLDRAPKCDEKYPHAHFIIGHTYLALKNKTEAKKYYYLGLEAENYRLPFNEPCYLQAKKTLETLVKMEKMKKK